MIELTNLNRGINNMSDESATFCVGILVGIIGIILLSIIFQATPTQQQQIDKQEAVDHGAAQWVATPKGEMHFVWITNK